MTAETMVQEKPASSDYDRLYKYTNTAEGVDGFESVGDAEIARFHEQGFLVVNNAFTPEEVQDALDGLLDLIDGKNPDFTGVQFEKHMMDQAETWPKEKKQDIIRKLMYFVNYDKRLYDMSEHPKLRSVLSRIMNAEPFMSQDMALLKPPFVGSEKPWHQDQAYFNIEQGQTIVGAWIALDEALPENGCMFVIPGSHKAGPVIHFQRRDWQLCDTDVAADRAVAVPLKPGGVLLFHCLMHHGTPPSRSERRRRAVQFHYKPTEAGKITNEERMAVFGSEGKDVSC